MGIIRHYAISAYHYWLTFYSTVSKCFYGGMIVNNAIKNFLYWLVLQPIVGLEDDTFAILDVTIDLSTPERPILRAMSNPADISISGLPFFCMRLAPNRFSICCFRKSTPIPYRQCFMRPPPSADSDEMGTWAMAWIGDERLISYGKEPCPHAALLRIFMILYLLSNPEHVSYSRPLASE